MSATKLFQIPIWFLLLAAIPACIPQQYATRSAAVLLKTDTDFSNLSGEKGVKAAFLHYIDDSAVLLKPGLYPLTGVAAKQYYENQTPDFKLTWLPQSGFIARSGELGYTYGIWTLAATDTTLQGTYVTIWKKQKDGGWKFVLDTGNSGVGKK